MSTEQRQRATAGLILFVALCVLGSWAIAASLSAFGVNGVPATLGTRLFTTSLLYTLTMGWQPIAATWVVRRWVDPPDHLDLGLRPAKASFYAVGSVSAIIIVAAATFVAWLAASAGVIDTTPFNGTAEAAVSAGVASWSGTFTLALAFAGTLLLVWTQAFAEEVGWRGYFLPRSMERFGPWKGLVLQGAVWGCWYAPVLFFASFRELDTFGSLSRCGAFVVTCALLGTLLGWLRLAARSVAPVMVANITLTLAAGLPYVIHGVDAGLRSAVFGAVGWTVLLATIGALLLSRWRYAVAVPAPFPLPVADASSGRALVRVWLILDGENRGNAARVLH